MKDFMSVNFYTITLLIRALWSLVICIFCITGMGISATNDIQHNVFEFCYFLICMFIELFAIFFYLALFKKQRPLQNLDRINRFDCTFTCIVNFLRIGWHVTLSLLIIVRINQLDLIKKNYQWFNIRALTILIMVLTVFNLGGFIVGIIYQPQEYEKELSFKSVFDDVKAQNDSISRQHRTSYNENQ